jgi:hypothetical protein
VISYVLSAMNGLPHRDPRVSASSPRHGSSSPS